MFLKALDDEIYLRWSGKAWHEFKMAFSNRFTDCGFNESAMAAQGIGNTLSNSQKPADLVPSSRDIKNTYDSEACRTDGILMMVHRKPAFNAITSDHRINLRSLQCLQAMDKQGLEACSNGCRMKRAASSSIRPCPVNFFGDLWLRTFETEVLPAAVHGNGVGWAINVKATNPVQLGQKVQWRGKCTLRTLKADLI